MPRAAPPWPGSRCEVYRATSLIRKRTALGPKHRPLSRVPGGSCGCVVLPLHRLASGFRFAELPHFDEVYRGTSLIRKHHPIRHN